MATLTEVDTGQMMAPADIRPALSWTEAAIVVLIEAGKPLRAAQIVEAVHEHNLVLASASRTPTQSVNRDLHSAARRGDRRVLEGPLPGQFCAGDPSAKTAVPDTRRTLPHKCVTRPTPSPVRLPIEPLQDAVRRAGGMRHVARPHVEPAVVQRLTRAFHRSINRGWIGLHDADAIAVLHLGLHPCLVWGPGWWDTLAEADAREQHHKS